MPPSSRRRLRGPARSRQRSDSPPHRRSPIRATPGAASRYGGVGGGKADAIHAYSSPSGAVGVPKPVSVPAAHTCVVGPERTNTPPDKRNGTDLRRVLSEADVEGDTVHSAATLVAIRTSIRVDAVSMSSGTTRLVGSPPSDHPFTDVGSIRRRNLSQFGRGGKCRRRRHASRVIARFAPLILVGPHVRVVDPVLETRPLLTNCSTCLGWPDARAGSIRAGAPST